MAHLSTKQFGRQKAKVQLDITDVKKFFIIFPPHTKTLTAILRNRRKDKVACHSMLLPSCLMMSTCCRKCGKRLHFRLASRTYFCRRKQLLFTQSSSHAQLAWGQAAHAQGAALHRHLCSMNDTSKRKEEPEDWHLFSIAHYLCTARTVTTKMEAFLGPRHLCCLQQVAGVFWLCRKGRKEMDAGCCVRADIKSLLLTGWKSFTWDTSGWKRSNWRGVCRYVRGQGKTGKDWNTPLVLPASIGLWCYRKLLKLIMNFIPILRTTYNRMWRCMRCMQGDGTGHCGMYAFGLLNAGKILFPIGCVTWTTWFWNICFKKLS